MPAKNPLIRPAATAVFAAVLLAACGTRSELTAPVRAAHPAPDADFMASVLEPLSRIVVAGGMRARDIKAGCGKCGACSALSTYEKLRVRA